MVDGIHVADPELGQSFDDDYYWIRGKFVTIDKWGIEKEKIKIKVLLFSRTEEASKKKIAG